MTDSQPIEEQLDEILRANFGVFGIREKDYVKAKQQILSLMLPKQRVQEVVDLVDLTPEQSKLINNNLFDLLGD